ncbi:unnamed protein product [Cyberlindnera jadinii]|uniref:Zn(2)-C6 fungal-type domain-containing protein n=1 Tax=Cyberlindnera jadinii (strain ATCC 18201 / CBS 1600 / BCRC 20928 / JCM 3617 / NBRC 0987 / NRRL Y-1542) TaxID=983966 RepID=A0A0H5CHB0_CYBJN|nr:unnamed protein product [Cyberlindnera jadinii]
MSALYQVSPSGTSSPNSSAPPAKFRNPHDKKGRSTSCLLCQKRKQKCDHRLPSCTTCIKAGVECVQPAKYAVKAPEKDEYTTMLEKKVKFLEKLLDANNIVIDPEGGNTKRSFKYKKLSPFLAEDSQIEQFEQAQRLMARQQNLPQMNKIIPIPTNRQLPYVDSMGGKNPYFSIDSIDVSNSLLDKYNLREFLAFDPVFEFDEKVSRAFLDIHFSRLQFKYPLLDEDEIFEFHNAYVTNNLTGYMNNNDFFYYCCSRMWLIFAISSCLHMSTGKYTGPPPERYFSTSMRHLAKCRTMSKLHEVEILTLIVLYLIRTDRDSSCLYDIIKDSMAICVSLKLNKSVTYIGLPPREKMKKMRTWWCVYLLERMISIAVGKPYTISERIVDIDIPLFVTEPSKVVHSSSPSVIFINQSIALRRIESRFVEELNILACIDPQNVKPQQLPLVERYFQELEVWRGLCSGFGSGIHNETLRLYYYRSVRLLIQPFLELMDPMDKLFRECQAAAGQICQLFKVFHQKTVFGHSTTAIHTVFVAGVTLIYCLWLARNKDDMNRRALGDVSKHTRPAVSESLFSGLNDLRACSICLYVMAERSKFALTFRDTFDQLMGATIGNLIKRCGPDSSEIIYNNQPGMPPAIVRRFQPISSGFGVESTQHTDEERFEQAERRRKQGQLQKSVVPKSLSHLLIVESPQQMESDLNVLKRNLPDSSPTSAFPDVTLAYPTATAAHSTSASSVSSTSTPQGYPASLPAEYTPFNGGANTMINNISAWSGESGVPITTSLFEKQADTSRAGPAVVHEPVNKGNYLWNVPVDDFWTHADEYGLPT